MGLPTELIILACLIVFAASFWIPFIIGVNTEPDENKPEDPFIRPLDLNQLRPWVHRAHRAHLNLLEQLLPFSLIVLLLDRVDGFTSVTYWAAVAFFSLRIAHAFGMISNTARFPIRPMIYVAAWVCILILVWQFFAGYANQPSL